MKPAFNGILAIETIVKESYLYHGDRKVSLVKKEIVTRRN
jgi:hypothetical protein